MVTRPLPAAQAAINWNGPHGTALPADAEAPLPPPNHTMMNYRTCRALATAAALLTTASLRAETEPAPIADLPAGTTEPLGQSFAEPREDGVLRVLIVGSGDAHHFPRYWLHMDAETLREAGGIDTAATPNLEEALELLPQADVLVFSGNHRQYGGEEFQQALNAFADRGGGLVMLHAAAWVHPWEGYNERFIGGGSRGHGFMDVEVTVKNPDHPVMRDVPATFTITDESYHHEFLDGADYELLAENGPDDRTNKPHASVWVKNDDKTRIVCITHGHDARAHENPAYQTMLVNAVRWVAEEPDEAE